MGPERGLSRGGSDVADPDATVGSGTLDDFGGAEQQQLFEPVEQGSDLLRTKHHGGPDRGCAPAYGEGGLMRP